MLNLKPARQARVPQLSARFVSRKAKIAGFAERLFHLSHKALKAGFLLATPPLNRSGYVGGSLHDGPRWKDKTLALRVISKIKKKK